MSRAKDFLRSLLTTTALRTPHPFTRNRPLVMIQEPLPQPTTYDYGTRPPPESFETASTTTVAG